MVQGHRSRLQKLATKPAVKKLKEVYDKATSEMVSRGRALTRKGMKTTYTMFQHKVVMSQLKQGQALLAQRMAGDMGPLTKKAQEHALTGLIDDIGTLNKRFTGAVVELPIEEAARFAGVVDKRRTSLTKMHATSFARYGANTVQDLEGDLSQSLLMGETVDGAIDRVETRLGGAWWQAERIVRTETAWAFNATQRDGIEESALEIPQLMMRWEEHCDEDGQPLDDRVAVDSIAMHGQVTTPGGLFTMPPTAPFADAKGETEVPDRLVGLRWGFPPNRPNDRSVLSPWMKEWGVPGWAWRNNRRHWL